MSTTGLPDRLQRPPAAARPAAAAVRPALVLDLDGQWGAGAGAVHGDVGAVAAANLPQLLRYATALTGDAREAAEVVERVLVRTRSRWRTSALAVRADLHLRRLVLREYSSRWRRRRPRRDGVAGAPGRTTGAHGPHRGAAGEDPLQRALRRLAPRDRAVLVLRYHEGLPDPEIAAVLGCSPTTVRRRAARALAAVGTTAPAPPAPHRSTEEQ